MQTVRSLRRTGSRAIALLLASLVCVGSADFRHTGWDDPACNPLPVQHDHNAHRLQAGQLPSGPVDDHCALCHSLRSLRAGLTPTPAAGSRQRQRLRPFVPRRPRSPAASRSRRPLRAVRPSTSCSDFVACVAAGFSRPVAVRLKADATVIFRRFVVVYYMRRPGASLGILLVCAGILGRIGVSAQGLGGAGTLQGVVKDPTGGVMQAVEVKIANAVSAASRGPRRPTRPAGTSSATCRPIRIT